MHIQTSRRVIARAGIATSALLFGTLALGCVGEVLDGSETEDEVESVTQGVVQDCSQILADGVFDRVKATSSNADTYALAKGFCKEVNKEASGGGKTAFWWGAIGGKLSAHASKNSWTKYCEHFDESSTSQETQSLMTSHANPDIVSAWAQCVTAQGGLVCYQKPGENVIGYTYEEQARSGDLAHVTLTPTNLKVLNPSDASPTLYVGDTGLAFKVTDAAKDAGLLLNGRTAKTNLAQSCSVVIKSKTKINAELKLAWRRLAADYKPIVDWAQGKVDDLQAVTITKNSFPVVARFAPLLKVAKAQYDNAKAQEAKCTGASTSCQTPMGEDFAMDATFPKVKCVPATGVGVTSRISPAKAYSYNVLDFDTSSPPAEWGDAFSNMGKNAFRCQIVK